MAKFFRKNQSGAAAGASVAANGKGGHDRAREDMNRNNEGGDERMLDLEEEPEIDLDADDGNAEAEHEKTAAKQPRKKKQHRKGGTLIPAEDGDFERPRKRHKLRSSDPSPGRSRSTIADSSSPVSSSPVSSSSELPADEPQSLLDLQPLSPTPPPSSLHRFPLPSRPHAPEKAELASQGLDRALASAQLVDPLLSTPLSPDEGGDNFTGLSAKTLRRLRDLGIVELFAGVYRVASRKPSFKVYNSSPDHAATFAPPFRTSQAVPVPPL
jgi:hypothetical protein